MNAQRARGATCGSQAFGPAPALEAHPALQGAARGHSVDMATNDYFDHTSRDGRTMVTRVRAAGYTGGAVGENIAAGRPTAEAVVDQWVQSPGHCSNLMSREFRFLGVGHAYRAGTRFGHYWTQNFGGLAPAPLPGRGVGGPGRPAARYSQAPSLTAQPSSSW